MSSEVRSFLSHTFKFESDIFQSWYLCCWTHQQEAERKGLLLDYLFVLDYSLRLFIRHRRMKGPGSSAVLRIRVETKGKWGILVWCILIIVFYLTDGIQYDEPSVGYGVASGSDQGWANWIDRSIGL